MVPEKKNKKTTSIHSNSLRPWVWVWVWCLSPDGASRHSEHQVLELGVDKGDHDGAGSVQDGAALHQGPGLGEPGLGLEAEVDGVQGHGEEVSEQGHGLRGQPEGGVTDGGGLDQPRWGALIRTDRLNRRSIHYIILLPSPTLIQTNHET